MAEKIRVGVAGVGFIGVIHARAYQQIENTALVAIADKDMHKAQSLASEFGCQSFNDYTDMLKRARLDVVSVCLPPALHLPAAEAAARAGVHILMEKPITRTVAEANQMIATCRDAGVHLMTGFTHRFYPEMREAKRLIANGAIGKPLTVLDSMSITYNLVLPWYRNAEIAGGGVFMTNAIHGFDRVSWVLDDHITRLTAQVEDRNGTQAEEYGTAIAQFAGGAQATFFQHWGAYRTVMCEMQVFGEEGTIHVRSWDSLEMIRDGEHTIRHFYRPEQGLAERSMVGIVAEISEMIASVREGRPPSPSGEDGRDALALVEATYQASATGQWVNVTRDN
ncbi:MAG: gfo/Idh/MocA family oxidoreductase [Chloroflexi bacterium]|nr:MAG: gfo/Idh/MocA family oxidoreductase [Chloroflexota bacterium]